MRFRRVLVATLCGLAAIGMVSAFQRPFRQYESMEPYDDVALPPDWQEKTEWVFARLMYPEHPNALFGGCGRFGRRGRRSRLARRRHQLDPGLSPRRPPLRAGAPPPHPHSCSQRGAARQPR